jgi:hypothetical protein
MTDLMIFAAGVAGGYGLAVATWSRLRSVFVGVENEITQLRTRASDLETRLRAAIGGNPSTGA